MTQVHEGEEAGNPARDQATLSWAAILADYGPRLGALGFDTTQIGDPTQIEVFSAFLADLQVKDHLLAAHLVRDVRRLAVPGSLPSARATKRRERRKRLKRGALMRNEGGEWVFDKRRAHLYAIGMVVLIAGPLMYVFGRPALNKKETPAATATRSGAGVSAARGSAGQGVPPPQSLRSSAPSAPPTSPAAQSPGKKLVGGAVSALDARVQAFKTGAQAQPGKVISPPPVTSQSAPVTQIWTPIRPAPATRPAQREAFGQSFYSASANAQPEAVENGAAPVPVREAAGFAGTPPVLTSRTTAPSSPERPFGQMQQTGSAARLEPPAPPTEELPQRLSKPVTSGLVFEDAQREATQQVAFREAASGVVQANSAPAPSADQPFGGVESASTQPEMTAMRSGEATASPSGASSAAPPSTALPAETPFGGDATNPATTLGATGPFRNLQQVSVKMVTAIYAVGGASVPVLVTTEDGGAFVGVGSVNGLLARVDLSFRRYVDPRGRVYEIDALGYTRAGGNLTQGVPARVQVVAPSLALDAAQNSASALQTAVAGALKSAQSSAPQVAVGDGATVSGPTLPPLWQILGGGLADTFKMPAGSQSIVRVAQIDSHTPLTVLIGLSAGN
jgi:hypothetical protein